MREGGKQKCGVQSHGLKQQKLIRFEIYFLL